MTTLLRYDLFIDGSYQPAATAKTYETIDPFSGKPWAIVPDGGEADVDRAVRAARSALAGPWGAMTGFERARLLRALATILERDADELARLETRDTGKSCARWARRRSTCRSGSTTSRARPTRFRA